MSGRPRDVELEKRLLAAAWSLLVDRGYEALTMSQVAAKADAHRSDLYRRWTNKSQLVSDTLAEHLPPISDPDTGSLRSDLSAVVDDLAVAWSAPWVDGLVGWLASLRHDPDSEWAFRAMAERRSRPMRRMIGRAVQRGEIDAVPDLSTVGNLIEGPLMHRRMFGGQDLPRELLDAVARSAYDVLVAEVKSS